MFGDEFAGDEGELAVEVVVCVERDVRSRRGRLFFFNLFTRDLLLLWGQIVDVLALFSE